MSGFSPVKKVSSFAGTKEDLPPTLAPTKPYDQQETLLGNVHFPPKNVLYLLFEYAFFMNGKLFIICATNINDRSYRTSTWFTQYFRET